MTAPVLPFKHARRRPTTSVRRSESRPIPEDPPVKTNATWHEQLEWILNCQRPRTECQRAVLREHIIAFGGDLYEFKWPESKPDGMD